MAHTIRVFLADPSADSLDLLQKELERCPDLTVVGAVQNGEDACALLSERTPDVLITDLLLPRLDGLALLRKLKEAGKLPHTVVLSAFVTDHIARALSRLGVDDLIPKPCGADELVLRIRDAAAASGRRVFREYDSAIKDALLGFGCSAHLKGYHFLEEGLRRVLEDPEMAHGVTKILYPDLARHFATTSACIERGMRGTISKAWERVSPAQRRARFPGLFDGKETPPGNAEFISAIAESIELEFDKIDVWKTE